MQFSAPKKYLFTDFNSVQLSAPHYRRENGGKICSRIGHESDTCAEWPMSQVRMARFKLNYYYYLRLCIQRPSVCAEIFAIPHVVEIGCKGRNDAVFFGDRTARRDSWKKKRTHLMNFCHRLVPLPAGVGAVARVWFVGIRPCRHGKILCREMRHQDLHALKAAFATVRANWWVIASRGGE